MKKVTILSVLSLFLPILYSGSLQAALSYEALTDKLETVGHDTFGATPLLSNFNPRMLEKWDPLIQESIEFIKKNASSDKKLINAMAGLAKVNTTISRAILRLNQVIAAGSALSQKEYDQEGQAGEKALAAAGQEINRVINNVDEKYILPGRKKSREILDTLDVILTEAADKGNREALGGSWAKWRRK